VEQGCKLHALPDNGSAIRSGSAYSEKSGRVCLAVVDNRGDLRTFDAESGACLHRARHFRHPIRMIEAEGGGARLLISDQEGRTVVMLDPEDETSANGVSGHEGELRYGSQKLDSWGYSVPSDRVSSSLSLSPGFSAIPCLPLRADWPG
jgi:hypothetical protein